MNIVTAPGGAVGMKIYCPVCYVQLTVPKTSATSPTAEPAIYKVDAKPIDVRELQDRKTLSLRCSVCHTNVSVTRSQAGTTIECPECQTKIPVSASFAQTTETPITKAEPKEVYGIQAHGAETAVPDNEQLLPFHCKLCGTLLYAPKDAAGKQYTCPDCGTKTVIPMRSMRKSAAEKITVKEFEGTNTFTVAENQEVAKSTEPLVPVVCSLCHTRMYALEKEIGGVKICPDCGTETEIKFVPKTERILPDINEEYTVAENGQAAPRPVFRTQTDYRYVKGSIDKAVNPDRYGSDEKSDLSYTSYTQRIPLPKFPFLSRFYKPLVNNDVLLRTLWTALLFDSGTLMYILAPGLNGGFNLLLSVFFGLVLFFCGLMYISQTVQNLFSSAAAGVAQPGKEDFSSFVPAEAIITTFWLLMILVLAATPGYFAGQFFSPQSEYSDLVCKFLCMASTTALFFPVFYLSSAEANSYFEVLARGTLTSLVSHPFAWLRFHLFALLIFIIPYCLLLIIEHFLGIIVLLLAAGLFFAVGMVLYFYLLGCLGFVLSFGRK